MNAAFLLKSLATKPLAEPIDAVKWLYQSEFGCGHLLPPEDDCAARIAQEMAQTAQTDAELPFEPLGDGLCRLNLSHPLTRALPPERIARMMRVTDGRVRGTQAGFEQKLAMLAALAERYGADTPDPVASERDGGERRAPLLPFQTPPSASIPCLGDLPPIRPETDVNPDRLRSPFTAKALAEAANRG